MPHFGELLIATVRAMFRTVIGEEVPGIQPPEHQPDAVLSQVNPVSGTLYTVLDTTENVRIYSVLAGIEWTVTQPTPLEVIITIDGITQTYSVDDPITYPVYYIARRMENRDDTEQVLEGTGNPGEYRTFLLEGRSIKVQIRITWATTQPTPLVCRVKWAKW